jgi:hypothetical protein
MRAYFLILLAGFMGFGIQAQELPLRADSAYEVEIAYSFKRRDAPLKDVVYVDKVVSQSNQSEAFLALQIQLLLQPAETRLRLVDSRGSVIIQRKLKLPHDLIEISMGFVNDLKRHKEGVTFTLEVLDAKKAGLNRIVFQVTENGDFLVNEKVFGKL